MYVSLVKKGDKDHRTYRRAVMMGNTYCIDDNGKCIAYVRSHKDYENLGKRICYIYLLNDETYDEYIDIIKRFVRKADKAEGKNVKRRVYNITRVNHLSVEINVLCF